MEWHAYISNAPIIKALENKDKCIRMYEKETCYEFQSIYELHPNPALISIGKHGIAAHADIAHLLLLMLEQFQIKATIHRVLYLS